VAEPLAVPFAERTRKELLSTHYGVDGIPTLVLVDGNSGATITTNGRMAAAFDPTGAEFPWYPKPLNEISPQSVQDINDVAVFLLFVNQSEEWSCPACSTRNTDPRGCQTCEQPRPADRSNQAVVKTGVDDAVATKAIEALRPLAVEVFESAKQAGKTSDINFLYGRADPVGGKVAQFVGVGTSAVAILDIPNRCKYILPLTPTEVTEKALRDFYAAYRDGSAKKQMLPRQAAEE